MYAQNTQRHSYQGMSKGKGHTVVLALVYKRSIFMTKGHHRIEGRVIVSQKPLWL